MTPFTFSIPTDKMPGAWHGSYGLYYPHLFERLKDTEDIILEIGVDGAGSLIAYRDWFNNAYIIGMDISACPQIVRSYDRVSHVQGNAYTADKVFEIGREGDIAVAIDDGPHTIESQEFFVQNYLPLLTQYGIGVVEDLQHSSHIAKLHAKLPPGFMGYGVDLRHQDGGRYDSLLFVAHRL